MAAQEASFLEEQRRDDALLLEAQRRSLQEVAKNVELVMEASRLSSKAVEYNMKEAEVPKDGNCQFHAAAQSLSEVQGVHTHVSVRRGAVEWLRQHPHFLLNQDDEDTMLCHYLDGDPSWEQYCNRMLRLGQFGDHLTLIAIAELYTSCIVVITSEKEGVNYHVAPRDDTPLDTIYLAHYPLAQHYNMLCLQGELPGHGVHLGGHMTTGFAYKVKCPNGQLRRLRTEYDALGGRLLLGHSELRAHIAGLCGIDEGNLLLMWEDDDGDLITFDTDEELLDAVRCAAAGGHKALRIATEECAQGEKCVSSGAAPAGADGGGVKAAGGGEAEWCIVDGAPPGD